MYTSDRYWHIVIHTSSLITHFDIHEIFPSFYVGYVQLRTQKTQTIAPNYQKSFSHLHCKTIAGYTDLIIHYKVIKVMTISRQQVTLNRIKSNYV